MLKSLRRFGASTSVALKCISLLTISVWLAAIANHLMPLEFNMFGILPRETSSLPGILLWPFLHGGFVHLVMNTSPLVILGFLVALRGVFVFSGASLFIVLFAGAAVWIFGRPAYHIGASGLVFGYFGFLVAMAFYEKRFSTFFIAGLVLFYYGGMIYGVLPRDEFVSFEGHLFGLIAGIVAANIFAKNIKVNRS